MPQNKKVILQDLGLIDYQKAWDYQKSIFEKTVQTKIENRKKELDGEQVKTTSNYLLFCQHPHVYTLGKSGKEENLLLSKERLQNYNASFYHINRGGDITYHGPGQLVGYPILDLDHFFTDIHKYIRFLEEAIILTLADYELRAGRIPKLTGVWLDHEQQANPRKICAIGVKMSRWVTMHGFALNVFPNLSYFNHIVPCGIDDKAVTSIEQELGYTPNIEEVGDRLLMHLKTVFDMEIIRE